MAISTWGALSILTVLALLVSRSDGSGNVVAEDFMVAKGAETDSSARERWTLWEESPFSDLATALEATVAAALHVPASADTLLELSNVSISAPDADSPAPPAARGHLRMDAAHRAVMLDNLPLPRIVLAARFTLNGEQGVSTSGELKLALEATASGAALLKRGDNGVDNGVANGVDKGVDDGVTLFLRYSPPPAVALLVIPDDAITNTTRLFAIPANNAQPVINALAQQIDAVAKEVLQEAVQVPERSLQVAVDEHLAAGNLDVLVDRALNYFRKWILREGWDSSALPNLDESIKHGYFKTFEGHFQRISTLQRVSDVLVTGPSTNAVIVGDFSLADLNFAYAKYRAKYIIIRIKGKVTGRVQVNRVRVGVRIKVGPPGVCSVALETFQVVQLDGISLRLTGPFPGKLSKLATRAVNRAKGKLIAMVEQHGVQVLQNVLAKLDCARTAALVAHSLSSSSKHAE